MENDDSYDEMKTDAKTCLSLMSQGLLYSEQIPQVLSALEEVTHNTHTHSQNKFNTARTVAVVDEPH